MPNRCLKFVKEKIWESDKLLPAKTFVKKQIDDIVYKYNNMKILDKYILRQVIEMFLMGVFVFSTIIFV